MVNIFGLGDQAGFGAQNCQPVLNLNRCIKASSLNITPFEVKPVLAANFLICLNKKCCLC